MLELLAGFAALSIVSGALTALLPDGSLRRTAGMVVGLMMLMYWYTGLQSLGNMLPHPVHAPATPLMQTGVTLPAATEEAAQ